ncbi:response regulator [Deferribacter thermophilus]|uniref:response regulator n=1 Tax=Deferribacter thermophilus TaxID=53573 RepID=UPI003C1FC8D8
MITTLIIEDDEQIAKLHSKILSNYDLIEIKAIANDVESGKEFCEIIQPDLILLDIYFPNGAEGIEFLKWLRKNNFLSDVIVITAAKEYNILQRTLKRGIFDYIIKPVTITRFKDSIERYIKFYEDLRKKRKIDQADIDSVILGKKNNKLSPVNDLPKGIDPITLNKVKDTISNLNKPYFTVELISEILEVSRNTARRYLEYLVSIGFLNVDQDYGTKGRPERKYFFNN